MCPSFSYFFYVLEILTPFSVLSGKVNFPTDVSEYMSRISGVALFFVCLFFIFFFNHFVKTRQFLGRGRGGGGGGGYTLYFEREKNVVVSFSEIIDIRNTKLAIFLYGESCRVGGGK